MSLTHRQQFADLLTGEMNKWGLIQQGWDYDYNYNPGKRLGQCIYKEKLLVFQLPYVDANPIVEGGVLHNTVKHEIGHALTGPGVGHGAAWKSLAMLVGYIPKACTIEETNVPANYIGTCKCKQHKWFRKPRHTSYRCKRCGENFTPIKVA